MVTAAAEMSGIPFTKFKRFAYVMNVAFVEKPTFYRLQGNLLNAYYTYNNKVLLNDILLPGALLTFTSNFVVKKLDLT